MRENESRLAGNETAKELAGSISSSLADDPYFADDLDTVINGALVTVVRTTEGRYRRRVYLSLKAAENAAKRAQDAGHHAEVILCELHALPRLNGGESWLS